MTLDQLRVFAAVAERSHVTRAAHALGMTTVLVSSNAQWISDEPSHKRPARPDDRHAHVHHVTEDLTGFLGLIETAA